MISTLLVSVALSVDPVACMPVPSEMKRYGEEVITAYRELTSSVDDPKAPKFATAPADARLMLRYVWSAAGSKTPLKALRPLMDDTFTWSLGGDADADQAVTEWAKDPKLPQAIRAAVTAKCKATKDDVTCTPKSGPRLVLEKKNGCWRWTAFVAGD